MNLFRKVSDMGYQYQLANQYIVEYKDKDGLTHTIPCLDKKQARHYRDEMKCIYGNAKIVLEKTFKSTKEY